MKDSQECSTDLIFTRSSYSTPREVTVQLRAWFGSSDKKGAARAAPPDDSPYKRLQNRDNITPRLFPILPVAGMANFVPLSKHLRLWSRYVRDIALIVRIYAGWMIVTGMTARGLNCQTIPAL